MKNKYLKYTLLSIAISSSLLLTSCGCGKKSEPLNEASTDTTAIEETTTDENTTESENNESMETVTNADRGQATGEVVSNQETEVPDTAITIEEGDYIEPSVNENLSEVESAIEQAKKDMQEFYEAGIISEEDYKAAMETLEKGPQTGSSIIPSESSQDAAAEAIAKKYEENAAKAREEMGTNGKGNQVIVEGDYDIDLPEHLKGDFIN